MTFRTLKGQTLVETVAALAVAVVIIAALVGMSVVSLRSSNLSRSKAIAGQLLFEEIERARVYRDTNSFAFFASDINNLSPLPTCPATTGALYIDSAQVLRFGTESLTSNNLSFSRTFKACYTDATNKIIEVEAFVNWVDSAGTHPIRSTTYFSNWR